MRLHAMDATAYFARAVIYSCKMFMKWATGRRGRRKQAGVDRLRQGHRRGLQRGATAIKLFSSSLSKTTDKLERLSLQALPA
jgi:hypothetical protein